MSRGNALAQKQAQPNTMHSYGSDKGRAIKVLIVFNSWDLEPWNLLKGLTLGCYQPSSDE